MTKRLVLLGGGHAHVHVLQAFSRDPPAGAELFLVTPFARQMYSGMVPGLVAGRFRQDECVIPLPPLAAAARARFVEGQAVALDGTTREVVLADGRRIGYDVLSIDTGAAMDRDRLPGARGHGLFVRPIEDFVRRLPRPDARAGPCDLAVLGGGAAGVELALALQQRLSGKGASPRVTLITGGPAPLAGHAVGAVRRVARVLAQRGIDVVRSECIAIESEAVVLADGTRLACDAPVIATGAESPAWLRRSGLALDDQGFVCTGPTLQSTSHAEVFAAGDVATRIDAPRPRSGVHAVRAGPPLAANLRRYVAGASLQPFMPQRRTLNLIACGDGSAIAAWGNGSAQGRWVGWWKDRIDRAFVARYGGGGASAVTGRRT